MGENVVTALLILHGLIGVALLGGITHQAMSACWPARNTDSFVASFRAVSGPRYTKATIVLYLVSMLLGGIVYTTYRLEVRPFLEMARLNKINGSFELKEQFAAIGMGMLPLYWLVWRAPLDAGMATARAVVTAILCFVVWYSFLAGHIVNNTRGVTGL